MAALATKYGLTVGQIRRHPGHPLASSAPAPTPPPVKAPRPARKAAPRREADEAPPSNVLPLTDAPQRALEHAREHVHDLREALRSARGEEKLELRKALTTAISTQGRLERADAESVSSILKSSDWADIRAALVETLRPWPEALAAVGRRLTEIDRRRAVSAPATTERAARAA